MESTYRVALLTPEKTVLEQEVVSLVAPGTEGFLGILARHAPLITGLVPGPLTLTEPSGGKQVYCLSGGFLEVSNNRVVILADAVELPEEIDAERAAAALDRARDRLKERRPDLDEERAEAALRRALNRLRVAERY